jgi:prophage regulatory protein
MQSKIIRLPTVHEMTGLPTSTIYYYIKNKSFPAPVSLGARSVGWRSDEIDDWIQTRQSTRKVK